MSTFDAGVPRKSAKLNTLSSFYKTYMEKASIISRTSGKRSKKGLTVFGNTVLCGRRKGFFVKLNPNQVTHETISGQWWWQVAPAE
jgi:hypothetical protein